MKKHILLGSSFQQPKGRGPRMQKTIGEYIEAGETVPTSQFLGMPGIGRSDIVSKSAVMARVAKERGLQLIDVRLSHDVSMSDFIGKVEKDK